jgi:hypothetical protein
VAGLGERGGLERIEFDVVLAQQRAGRAPGAARLDKVGELPINR